MRIIRESNLRKLLKEAYEKGLNKGYELGWQMRAVERTNRGFITAGSKLDQELEEILKGGDGNDSDRN